MSSKAGAIHIQAGLSYKTIVDQLKKQEICEITVESFRTILYRLRKKRSKALKTKQPAATKNVPVQNEKKLELAFDVKDGKNSAGLDSKSNSDQDTLSFEEIEEKYPHLSVAEKRDKFSSQFLNPPVHPLIQKLLEKK